ncbi:UDP-GlcNAc:polypeptide alpha-N-acetylglucosaminyltransferase [Angomonas deanei]|uniref:Glycosyltransferase (GlcNAc), putative n=1 Tax=Angomonas deanei TaxID=59799 RepID=A0A7G2CT88_9TRYP|nr:UDP-GlcNAc:polypeptide alpha-N-acetylglucosaminyltransferase [Angomonas deanei]CAD2221653.1 Glycosyltransferase (GlcNAc), putative [Angomonas deanei]|eukprot:EPY32444.1 UDP-GlcNAc:polypeptide alpha-N-acetylglucosaminyltransferase [Angomonas deanei]
MCRLLRTPRSATPFTTPPCLCPSPPSVTRSVRIPWRVYCGEAKSPHRLYFGISEEREAGGAQLPGATRGRLGARRHGGHEKAKQLLYGANAPVDRIKLQRRFYTWDTYAETLVTCGKSAPPKIQTVQHYMDEKDLTTQNFNRHGTLIPREELLLDQSYPEDKIICLAGDVESVRDNYRLEAHCNRGFGPLAYRPGRGGAQEGPFRAASGCRVLSRVTGKKNALGPTYGRYVASLFYMKQDYYMVVDSHSRFSLHFDVKMILRVFQAPTRAVLSHYPNGYRPEAPTEEYGKTDVMSMCKGQILSNAMPKLGAEWINLKSAPVLEAFAAAGYMFGESGYVLANPFDPFLPHLFDGEEILYSARMWTSGYDIYCPAAVNVLHHYGRAGAKRDWGDPVNGVKRRERSEKRGLYLLQRYTPWAETEERFNKIQVHMKEAKEKFYKEQNGTGDLVKAAIDGIQNALSRPAHTTAKQRIVVKDEDAKSIPQLHVFRGYYGMGSERTLEAYWEHSELTDAYVKKRDGEGRWEGGTNLCEKGRRA